MGKYRKRFNEKARSGMLSKQANLKRARNKQFTRHSEEHNDVDVHNTENIFSGTDSNSEILKPMTEEEKAERKRKLEETLYSSNQKESKLSRSKKKRLDKYIEHQLKREEKKVLLEKLSKTKIDTTILAPSKLLGTGKQTRKEEFIEALELERQGRGDERTKEILYEEREVKEWEGDAGADFPQIKKMGYESESQNSSEQDEIEDEEDFNKYGDDQSFPSTTNKSSFVDYRPEKFGGQGIGFGFSNLPKLEKPRKTASKKKYSWRLRVEQEDKKKLQIEDENDFISSDDEGEFDSKNVENVTESSENESDKPDVATKEKYDSENDNEEEFDAESFQKNESHEIIDDNNDSSDDDDDDDSEAEGSEDDDSEDEDSEDDNDDSEDEDSEDDDDEEKPKLMRNKPKHSESAQSFKEWAEKEIRRLEGREESIKTPILPEKLRQQYSIPTVHEEDIDHSSDEENYISVNKDLKRDAFYVDVTRSPEIQKQRMGLPVFGEEHRIMEAVYHHDCIVLCGETGSGKTTQVPQFLYESGFGNCKNDTYPGIIGVTQPRRVAAVSMAERVGNELGDHKHRVGYQIRFDTTIKNEGAEDGTALKFMTDGVLLREMMTDLMLHKYSTIIIDEAHERNINTDILIGLLSRILKLRRKYHENNPEKYKVLKLIIMSATLRVSDFAENKVLFKTPPPILKIDARQYPVSVHFDKVTKYDYLEEAFKKACKIHKRLPPGGILLFLTGQNEITSIVKRLSQEFPFPDKNKKSSLNHLQSVPKFKANKNTNVEVEDIEFSVEIEKNDFDEDQDDYNSSDEEGFEEILESHQSEKDPLCVLPLYSLLPTSEQMKVFQTPPKGSRLCVVATNVAETSLTIPGIRYVIDCGRSKERKFNEETGVQSFEIDWVSKASADQRAGRAGRTGPGHCYRLFSSAIYESYFPQFSKPEILRMPFESIVLSMKSMGIDQIVNFPFPTAPDRTSLSKAEKLLLILGALNKQGMITDLGKTMSSFPLSPRFSKILIIGNQQDCLPYIIAIVSALSVGDPFLNEHELGINETQQKKEVNDKDPDSDSDSNSNYRKAHDEEVQESFQEEERKRKLRSKFQLSRATFSKLDKSSDCLRLLSAVCAFDHVPRDKKQDFLRNNFLRPKVMEEIVKLRKQLMYIVMSRTSKDSIANTDSEKDLKLGVPTKQQISALKQMIASGFIDQLAIRGDLISSDIAIPNKSNIINIPYKTLYPSSKYDEEIDPYVYIHPNSVLNNAGELPGQYLVYQSLNLGSNKQEGKLQKLRMKILVDISGKQIANIAKTSSLLTYSKPLGHPYAPKNISATKRECYVVPRIGAAIGDGGVGWDLPVIKAIQNKINGSWEMEK